MPTCTYMHAQYMHATCTHHAGPLLSAGAPKTVVNVSLTQSSLVTNLTAAQESTNLVLSGENTCTMLRYVLGHRVSNRQALLSSYLSQRNCVQ